MGTDAMSTEEAVGSLPLIPTRRWLRPCAAAGVDALYALWTTPAVRQFL